VVLGEIIGPDMLIILLVVLVLFGSSQLPKLARSPVTSTIRSQSCSPAAYATGPTRY
jgi:Sec-independent protein translocase protein TatA